MTLKELWNNLGPVLLYRQLRDDLESRLRAN